MKKLTVGSDTVYEGTEHLVLDVDKEGILIHFSSSVGAGQIDDLLIVTPDGEVLVSWTVTHDVDTFPEDKCILISPRDNLKEIGNLKTTLLAIRAKEEKTLKVYITVQRN